MKNNNIGIYPGVFDPITFGHLDIIKRSLNIVDNIIVAIGENIKKKTLFTISERQELIKNDIDYSLHDCSKIQIKSFKGLLTDFAKENKATCIIRGLRVVSDFEYEFQMTGMNHQLNPNIETIFLMSSDKKSFISSKLVKEVHKLGGDVSNFVSQNTISNLNNKNH